MTPNNTEILLASVDDDEYTYNIIETESEVGDLYLVEFEFVNEFNLNDTDITVQFKLPITDLAGN